MKKIDRFILVFSLLVLLSEFSLAQIENSSFENWDTTPWVQPAGWGVAINGIIDVVTQSSDAHDGSSSAKMEIKELLSERVDPNMESGGFGDPINIRPSKLQLFYKADFKNFSRLTIHISTWDSNASTGSLLPSGSANAIVRNSTANWTSVEVPIDYFGTLHTPAYISIIIALKDSAESNDLSALGSFVLIDNLSLDQTTEVVEIDGIPKYFKLSQNYPNPFNPSTRIDYSITESSFVKLIVYDILGNPVSELVNEDQSPGKYSYNFDGSNLSSGTYFVRLNSGEFSDTKKITLLK